MPTISKLCIIAANNIGHTNQITDSSLLSSTYKYSRVVLVFRFSKYNVAYFYSINHLQPRI